jgi:cytochrome c oxidase cbb3-type subunit III
MKQNKLDPSEIDPNVTEEHDMDVEGHDYDGIKELDNPPPGWIMAIFYITIAASIFYAAYFFWLKVGDKQDAEYAKATVQYNEKYKKNNEASAALALLTDETSLAEGQAIFKEMNCVTCHGPNGGGNAVGPNLTDEYWLHGCKFEQVFSLIKNGFPTKGMTAFKGQLTDEKIQKVASYILVKFKESNPADAKAPQGELCE